MLQLPNEQRLLCSKVRKCRTDTCKTDCHIQSVYTLIGSQYSGRYNSTVPVELWATTDLRRWRKSPGIEVNSNTYSYRSKLIRRNFAASPRTFAITYNKL